MGRKLMGMKSIGIGTAIALTIVLLIERGIFPIVLIARHIFIEHTRNAFAWTIAFKEFLHNFRWKFPRMHQSIHHNDAFIR